MQLYEKEVRDSGESMRHGPGSSLQFSIIDTRVCRKPLAKVKNMFNYFRLSFSKLYYAISAVVINEGQGFVKALNGEQETTLKKEKCLCQKDL